MSIVAIGSTKDALFDVSESATLTAAVNIEDSNLVGLIMPAAWDTADITFQVSVDGTNFYDLYDEDGSEVTIIADTSRYLGFLDAVTLFSGINHIKLRSGSTTSAVNQTADRIIQLVVRPV